MASLLHCPSYHLNSIFILHSCNCLHTLHSLLSLTCLGKRALPSTMGDVSSLVPSIAAPSTTMGLPPTSNPTSPAHKMARVEQQEEAAVGNKVAAVAGKLQNSASLAYLTLVALCQLNCVCYKKSFPCISCCCRREPAFISHQWGTL